MQTAVKSTAETADRSIDWYKTKLRRIFEEAGIDASDNLLHEFSAALKTGEMMDMRFAEAAFNGLTPPTRQRLVRRLALIAAEQG